MSAAEPLCLLIGINPCRLNKQEILFVQVELFSQICSVLKNYFRERYKHYFRLAKFTKEMEDAMLDCDFYRLIINDILATEEYTLEGMACYTQTPQDILCDIVVGHHSRPSAIFLEKLIELHRLVRRDFYRAMMQKIVLDYVDVNEEGGR